MKEPQHSWSPGCQKPIPSGLIDRVVPKQGYQAAEVPNVRLRLCYPSRSLGYRDSQGFWLRTHRLLLEASLPAVPGFSSHPATALGLAGPSSTWGFLGGLLGPMRVFPLDLLPTVCMQCGCEGGDAVGKVEAGEARALAYLRDSGNGGRPRFTDGKLR